MHHGRDSTKNIVREFASDFEVGECWGYNRLANPSHTCSLLVRVVDPHLFNADPDPAFFLFAYPDPVPNAGF